MKGRFFAVGVGCGDPELLTLKAVRIIRECDVVALPMKKQDEEIFAYEIAKKAIPEIDEKEIIKVFMPMIKASEELDKIHQKGAEEIEDLLEQGKNIAFLTIGDVCIYSSAIYIYTKIKDDGFPCEIVSGIPSFCSAAARMGISLCEGEEKLHIIPSFNIDADETIKNHSGNFVFMKSSRKINHVVGSVKSNSKIKEAFLAENVSLETEKIINIKTQDTADTGYFSIIIAKKSEDI
ncbi:MAG: precorrin-2 C(20)-methyltransferase [Oscillospiraceae bacterium]